METLDKVLEYWAQDSVVDETEASRAIVRIPILHSKYLNILSSHKLASKKAMFDYNRLRKTKWEYYTGKMSQEELEEHGWEPFRYTLKSDVTTYLEADNDLIRLLEKKVYHDEVVSICEAILKELNSRTWQLKEYMAWEKFIHGAH
jgi:hypothetical protein